MSLVSRKLDLAGVTAVDLPGEQGAAVALDRVSLWVSGREGRVELLKPVSWRVEPGEHWAILGPNGAGKSSLLSLCCASRHPSTGSTWVLGERLGRTDMRALRERIGIVDAATALRVPGVLTLLDVALTGATGTVLPRPEVYDEANRHRAAVELDRVGLNALRQRRFAECSQGERQRALLARALVGRPELLLLDEAAVGLDLPAREAMLAGLVGAAADEPSRASITVTHHVEELPPTTSQVLLLRAGEVIAAGPIGEVLTDELLTRTFGLPVRVRFADGRWTAHAAPGWSSAAGRAT